ncbi:phosphoglycolate phosphatase [Prevotella sp. CAG:891]|nr:phosphoglycolate phosphatase [Prevotella sp. CAG:891]
MIRSILFDLDGTLLDTLDDLANSVNYALRTHHLPERSHTEIRSFLGNGIRNLMLDAVGRGMSDEAFEPVFQTFRTYYVEHCLDKSKPFAGIIDLLKALQQRGITMAVVSNKLHPAVVELNERFFKDYITSAVGESATVRRKPNPDAVLAALSELGCSKDEAVYVGDSEVDLLTAQNAGMQCMLVLWGFRDEDFLRSLPGASLFAQCPADILSWLDTQC